MDSSALSQGQGDRAQGRVLGQGRRGARALERQVVSGEIRWACVLQMLRMALGDGAEKRMRGGHHRGFDIFGGVLREQCGGLQLRRQWCAGLL